MITNATRTKLITFQSWVTCWAWYQYATHHPERVPWLLIDRSPCPDPYFDPYASSHTERRVLISGLCRGMKGFRPGNRFIYITRIDPKVGDVLGITVADDRPSYFGVAALVVHRVWPSHAAAAITFQPRQYVVSPSSTSYPPNLAHDPQPVAAASLESSIIHDANKRAYTPDYATETQWRKQYRTYYCRMHDGQLQVAECHVETVDGLPAIALDPSLAPVLTPADWGGLQMNVAGRWIDECCASRLRECMAQVGET